MTRQPRAPRCPTDERHGPLLDWPTARWGFHCPHSDHYRDHSRNFFKTDEGDPQAMRPRAG